MGNLCFRRVELPACPNLSKCNDNLPFTKGRQHGPNPAGGGLIGKIPWNLLEKRIEASFGGNSSHLNLTAPPSVPIAIAQTAGISAGDPLSFASLRPCVFAFSSSKQPDLCGRSTTARDLLGAEGCLRKKAPPSNFGFWTRGSALGPQHTSGGRACCTLAIPRFPRPQGDVRRTISGVFQAAFGTSRNRSLPRHSRPTDSEASPDGSECS
jgi:hypothetical protein